MLLLWPSKETSKMVLNTIASVGLEVLSLKESKSDDSYHIPIIFDESRGEVVREAHEFLYEKSYYSEYYKSDKTVRTYAECILCWLKYTISTGIDWRSANVRNIAHYRNVMKASGGRNEKVLSAATINLRLAVVFEFYKFYWSKLSQQGGGDTHLYTHRLNQLKMNKVRVKAAKKRPRAIPQHSCQMLMKSLRGVHRVIFAWTLTTGLRVSSVLSITSAQVNSLTHSSSDGFIEVPSKGGKRQKAYVPRSLLLETIKYAEILRVLSRKKLHSWSVDESLFFINERGVSVTRSCYYTAYKRACKKLEITSHPHQARTTFATFMERQLFKATRELGLDHIKIVQGLLGHASADTTKDYLESISGSHVEVLKILERYAISVGGANE